MRDRALNRGLKLNEYGFERPDGSAHPLRARGRCVRHAGAALDPAGDPRGRRRDRGRRRRAGCPTWSRVADIKGDLHNHSTWSDGTTTIEEMARAAAGARLRLHGDHRPQPEPDHRPRHDAWSRSAPRRRRCAEVNRKLAPFRVLHGVELEIKTDGTLDYPDEVLAELDIVVASVHQGLRHEAERVTERACSTPAATRTWTSSPTRPGSILGSREPSGLDVEALIDAAARNRHGAGDQRLARTPGPERVLYPPRGGSKCAVIR